MTSQASELIKAIQLSEIILTSIYVFLTLIDLDMTKESLELIIHLMGIVRVNAFSVTQGEDTIATGLYWPANFINHDCAQPRANIQPETNSLN
jgi:hypothetical protein